MVTGRGGGTGFHQFQVSGLRLLQLLPRSFEGCVFKGGLRLLQLLPRSFQGCVFKGGLYGKFIDQILLFLLHPQER